MSLNEHRLHHAFIASKRMHRDSPLGAGCPDESPWEKCEPQSCGYSAEYGFERPELQYPEADDAPAEVVGGGDRPHFSKASGVSPR